ncbi:hypothetical protein [Dyella koreensis]|uniref:Uncharacterized protein n=1 Tax=Dyella koreensis TaxID=311235 RepID=A0ABW8K2J9_9GAMM
MPHDPFGRPFYLVDPDEEPRRQRTQQQAGIAIAINELRHLIAYSDIARDLQARHLTAENRHWPLSAARKEGLHAAIHFLNQYAQSLGHEP